MELDKRTKGQLGLKGAQGMWQRLDLFSRNRKRRQSPVKSACASVAKSDPGVVGIIRTFVGVFTTPTGETRKRVYKDCTRSQASKRYERDSRRNTWTMHALELDVGW